MGGEVSSHKEPGIKGTAPTTTRVTTCPLSFYLPHPYRNSPSAKKMLPAKEAEILGGRIQFLAIVAWLLFCGEGKRKKIIMAEQEVPTDPWRLPVSPGVAKASPPPPHSRT